MKKVFADAQYFVALINDKDQSHPAALAISQTLQGGQSLPPRKRSAKCWRTSLSEAAI